MVDASPLRQVLEATGAGALVGSMIGAISSYLKSPVVVGYSRAPVWRDVSVELFSSTKWWAGTFFTYVFVKNFSAQARGLSQPDGLSSFTAGAVTGAIYTLRYGISPRSMVGLGLLSGFGTYVFEGPWRHFSPLHRRGEIQKYISSVTFLLTYFSDSYVRANDLELNLRYKQKVAEDKARVEAQLIALEKKAIDQIQ